MGKTSFIGRRELLRYAATASGFLVTGRGLAQTSPCPPELSVGNNAPSSGSGNCSADLETDWQNRISAQGVLWYHDFRSDSEITQFLWASGYGDDPGRTQTKSTWVTRQTSDGITGGGCLEILRPSGTADPGEWGRPMAALQDSGHGQPDPGWSAGMPTTSPTQGDGTRLYNWQFATGLPGTYGDPKEGTFTGKHFYLQLRVKVDPRRTAQAIDGGKICYITTGDGRVVAQEMVTYYKNGVDFSIYQGEGLNANNQVRNYQEIINSQVLGTYDQLYPDEWVTYYYDISVGSEYQNMVDDGTDVPTILKVYRARAGETSYTLIMERTDLRVDFQDGGTFAYNVFLLNSYHNGINMTEFWVRYDQIIFSNQPIACPQV